MSDRGANLRAWSAGWANRNYGPVDILSIADSVTEGAGATVQNRRWWDLLRDGLRAKGQPAGVAGGVGYVPAYSYYNNPAVTTGTVTQPSTDGLGYLGLTLSPAATWTLTFTGTALDVFVTKNSGGGTLAVSVDGASTGTGFATIATANATKVSGSKTRVGGLTAGTHTVIITCSTATAVLEGVMVYNGDETKGIRVWNNAHSGNTAGSFTGTPAVWTGAVASIQPSLIVGFLGINDWRTAPDASAPSNYLSNYMTAIAAARAVCTIKPSVLLVVPYVPLVGTNTANASYQVFHNQLVQMQRSIGDVELVNLFARTGGMGFQSNQMGLLSADNIHPSDKGHQFIADAVLGKIVA